MTIGSQLIETIEKTTECKGLKALNLAIELLEQVGIPEAKLRLSAYPHQFSGGMRQRVVIALALAGNPELIIADEPTTALDVSLQAQILDLIKEQCKNKGLGVIFVTHDIGVIANIADRVAVMYRGEIVEHGGVSQILGDPQHEYTKSLISAVPRSDKRLHRFKSIDYIDGNSETFRRINIKKHWLGQTVMPSGSTSVIEVKNLSLSFTLKKSLIKSRRKLIRAVDQVSFAVESGETFGLVGESGSGKSTVARLIAGLHTPDEGVIEISGTNFHHKKRGQVKRNLGRSLQMIFQDPYSSLNSRMRVLDIVAEPIRFNKLSRDETDTRRIVDDLLEHVGLGSKAALRYPHEFSGGQRQRISIARALASRPRILICDEPTSALDVSVQATILNLLKDLQQELGLTMLFISHDLPVIRQMCDRIAVMKNGKVCEIATAEKLFTEPQHQYTQELLKLMPNTDLLMKL
jgi:peptide/nickel transport system ATP-binding protein